MTEYLRLPQRYQAVQWRGDNHAEVIALAGHAFQGVDEEDAAEDPDMTAALLAGPHNTWTPMYDGDWVLRAADGQLTRRTAEQFAAEFERA